MFTLIDTDAGSEMIVHAKGCSGIARDIKRFEKMYGKAFTYVEDKDNINYIISLSGAEEVLGDHMGEDDPQWSSALAAEVISMVNVQPCAHDEFMAKLQEAV